MTNLLTIVTVNYFGAPATREFLLSYLSAFSFAESEMRPHVVVVDTSNSVEEFSKLTAACSEFGSNFVSLVRAPANLGYFGGCNFGRDYALQSGCNAKWFAFCNNDVLWDPESGRALVTALGECQVDVVAISPDIYDAKSRTPLNPFLIHRPTAEQIASLRFIHSNYWLAFLFDLRGMVKRALGLKRALTSAGSLYAGHGSFIVMASHLIGDGIDCAYFMYAEEISVAERCRVTGGKWIYLREVKIIHNSHTSTGSFLSRKTYRWKKNALKYIYDKYTWN